MAHDRKTVFGEVFIPSGKQSGGGHRRYTRREALGHLILPLAGALPAFVACSRGPKCDDTSGLSPEDVKTRTDVAYVEHSLEAAKRCDVCIQFVGGSPGGCGTCKVVKGPINPAGTCKLFVAKPAS